MKKFAKTSMAVLLYIASYTSVFPAHALDEIFAQEQNIHNTSVAVSYTHLTLPTIA